jgi:N-acetylglucosaminyldiphosphoundecaprenol N-acetyl-beta-D-mannosaminyltransferase
MRSVPILNCDVDAVTLGAATDWARDWIHDGRRGYICTVNVAILMMMRSDPKLQRFVDRASLVVADGQPLVWASRLQDQQLPERVTGVDLVDELCALAAKEGFGVYFLGARLPIVEAVAQRLTERHPGLDACGIADGYFDPSEASERAQAIRESGANILIVGMGVPLQEEFIENHWDQLGVQLAIPVGGSFDVIAGATRRAPVWLQRIGMEWFFRLVQEPGRLWKRYLVTNTQFIFHLARQFLFERGKEVDRAAPRRH